MFYDSWSTNSRWRNHKKARRSSGPKRYDGILTEGERIHIQHDFASLELRVAARMSDFKCVDGQTLHSMTTSLTGRVDAFQPEFQQIKRGG